jgi:hypothetical protein
MVGDVIFQPRSIPLVYLQAAFEAKRPNVQWHQQRPALFVRESLPRFHLRAVDGEFGSVRLAANLIHL